MKEIIQHPVYGEIIYHESFWLGRKNLIVNRVIAQQISKKEFMIGEKKATIKGSYLTGVSILIDDKAIELSPKTKWYEYLLAFLPLLFLLVWGNSVALCSIFPVVGGAIGGGLGGLCSGTSLSFIRKTKSTMTKVVIGIGLFATSILLAFFMAIIIALLIF